VASLLTGRSPIVHQAQGRGDVLAPGTVTLARRLGDAGYRTYALYGNAWVGGTFRVDDGFEESRLLPARSDRLTRELIGRLGRLAPQERLFAYVHTIDPHAPYDPTPAYRRRFSPPAARHTRVSALWLEAEATRARSGEATARRTVEEVTALYDAEVAFNDRQFGLFVDELTRLGLYDDSLIVFTSDHGEELFDHGGVAHGQTLYREVLEVPLVVKWPRGRNPGPDAGAAVVPLLDVAPTVLECAGLSLPSDLEGRSLLGAPAGLGGPAGGISSYLDLDGVQLQSVTDGRWKLVRAGPLDRPRPRLQLFDLDEGREATDVTALHPAVAERLSARLVAEAARRPRTPPPQAELPADVLERLRAMGYVR
jgi:arylsulfatase A-like enzyme